MLYYIEYSISFNQGVEGSESDLGEILEIFLFWRDPLLGTKLCMGPPRNMLVGGR